MVFPTFHADIPSDNTFYCDMIVALALETPDWFVLAFGYGYLLVAYNEAIENSFVCTIWACEGDDHMPHYLVQVLSLWSLGPPTLADGFFGETVQLCQLFNM